MHVCEVECEHVCVCVCVRWNVGVCVCVCVCAEGQSSVNMLFQGFPDMETLELFKALNNPPSISHMFTPRNLSFPCSERPLSGLGLSQRPYTGNQLR